MSKNKISIILGIVCMLLTIGICVQLKTIQDAKKTVGTSLSENNKLKDEVLKWKEKYDNAYAELEDLESYLEISRKRATENNEESARVEKELTLSNKLLGLTQVKGKGVIITLDDNRDATLETIGNLNISDFLIHDGDILQVVNELKNAGAEAISVNGERIVHTTGILCDGNVISINGNKVGAPFVIKAIGFSEKLYYALARTEGYLQSILRGGAQADIEISEEDIIIPKYEGIFSYDYIR